MAVSLCLLLCLWCFIKEIQNKKLERLEFERLFFELSGQAHLTSPRNSWLLGLFVEINELLLFVQKMLPFQYNQWPTDSWYMESSEPALWSICKSDAMHQKSDKLAYPLAFSEITFFFRFFHLMTKQVSLKIYLKMRIKPKQLRFTKTGLIPQVVPRHQVAICSQDLDFPPANRYPQSQGCLTWQICWDTYISMGAVSIWTISMIWN